MSIKIGLWASMSVRNRKSRKMTNDEAFTQRANNLVFGLAKGKVAKQARPGF